MIHQNPIKYQVGSDGSFVFFLGMRKIDDDDDDDDDKVL